MSSPSLSPSLIADSHRSPQIFPPHRPHRRPNSLYSNFHYSRQPNLIHVQGPIPHQLRCFRHSRRLQRPCHYCTSVSTTVPASDVSSCLCQPVRRDFSFYINPKAQFQCMPTQFSLQQLYRGSLPDNSLQPYRRWGDVPGTRPSAEIVSFNYTLNFRAGPPVTFIFGDAGDIGAGGTSKATIFQGLNDVGSDTRFNAKSPSTLGPPAGAITGAPPPITRYALPAFASLVQCSY